MYSHILVPYDGSATSRLGLDEAIRVARDFGSTLEVVHAVDDVSLAFAIDAYYADAASWQGSLMEAGLRLVKEAEAIVTQAGVPVQTAVVHVLEGSMGEAIVNHANRSKAQLIVMGTHGRRGIGRAVLGSGAESVARLSAVPVLLVRRPEPIKAQPANPDQLVCSLPSAALAIE